MTWRSARYDEYANVIQATTGAELAIVVVLAGHRGTGFSVASTKIIPPSVVAEMLRTLADQIERENKH